MYVDPAALAVSDRDDGSMISSLFDKLNDAVPVSGMSVFGQRTPAPAVRASGEDEQGHSLSQRYPERLSAFSHCLKLKLQPHESSTERSTFNHVVASQPFHDYLSFLSLGCCGSCSNCLHGIQDAVTKKC